MDGLGECGCSGVVGNHIQIAIHPYFGFAIIPVFNATVGAIAPDTQCNYPLYTQRDIVFDEVSQWNGNVFRVTTIRQVVNVYTGEITETLISQTGDVFPNQPTMPSGIPWDDFTRYDQGVSETTQQTIIIKGSGSFIDWGYVIHIYVTLSVPNTLESWRARCDALKWFASIENIRSKLSENPDYSLTLWAYNLDGQSCCIDSYGTPGLTEASLRYTDCTEYDFSSWIDTGFEFPMWMDWSVFRGFTYNRKSMNGTTADMIYHEPKFQPYAIPVGISFQSSVRLFTLPDTTVVPPSSNPNTHYLFLQTLFSGTCENTLSNTGHTFDLSADTETTLDMNETATTNPDTGRMLRGTQVITTELG